MENSTSNKNNSAFYYDEKRTALEIPHIEQLVIAGKATDHQANEVVMGYLDYIFSTLNAVDEAYMNRSHDLSVDFRLAVVNRGISICLEVISRNKQTFKHYPLCLRMLDGVYSAVRFQDVFTVSAINNELNSGSYFEQDSFLIH